jgi:large subunit ribosomal protein L29
MKANADKARGMDVAELEKQVKDSAEQMFRLRFQMSMGQMDGLKKVRELRKERARMMTILRERELHAAQAPAAPVVTKAAAKTKAVKAKKAK